MILFAIIILFLTVIGIFLFIRNPLFGLLYTFGLYNIEPFIIAKYFPLFFGFNGFFIQAFILLSFVILLFYKNKIITFIKHPLFLYLVLIHIYLLILSLYRDLDALKYITDYRRNMNNIIVFFFPIIFKINFNKKLIIRVLLVIFIFHTIISIISYFGPNAIYNFFTVELNYLWDTISINNTTQIETIISKGKLVSSTLIKTNIFAETFAIISLIILFLTKSARSTWLIIIFFSLIVLGLSGIRTAVISFSFGIVLYALYYKKRHLVLFSILFILISSYMSFSITNMSKNFNEYNTNYTNPFERIMGATIIFNGVDKIKKDNESNIALSINLLDKYFDSPFFGRGEIYKKGYGKIKNENGNTTDVTLALYIVEYGIFNMLFLLFPYFYIIYLLHKSNNKEHFRLNIVLFFVMILFTVSDKGIFQPQINYLYFLIAGLQINDIKFKKT